MDTLETLYFPDTVIVTDGQSPLFLFFKPVHFLQPVETDEDDHRAARLSDTFMDGGFCQAHTPAPLGADRDRFLHLVHDIEKRKDDYAAQLSALAIASMSAKKNDDEHSRHTIISTLLGDSGQDPEAREKAAAERAELWQARLVLAIAEILDHEEEEIADALNILEKSKTDLFARLLGKDEEFEDDAPFSDLTQLREKVQLPRPGAIKNRLKAWISLYRAGNLPDWWLWTTTRTEAADILMEMFEKKTGGTALTFLQIELPAATGIEMQDHMDKIVAFRKEAAPLIAGLAERFNTLVRQEFTGELEPAGLLPESGAWEGQWAALLETHFPADLYGRAPCRFHLFRDLRLSELAAAPDKNAASGTGVRHGILAVIG